MSREKILVTGGLGFIGSHTVVKLIEAGYHPVIADDLSNAKLFILDRIEEIISVRPAFYKIR
jgi:UDP-glucose 4-epimerase